MPVKEKKEKEPIDAFTFHGFIIDNESGKQRIGACIFCGSSQKMYVNATNGQWDCKKCGREGNIPTFLEELCDHHREHTTTVDDWNRLARMRALDVGTLKAAELAWGGEVWLVPTRGASGHVVQVRRWTEYTRKMIGTPTCHAAIWNIGDLIAQSKMRWPVYICEGEWDGMALRHLFKTVGHHGAVVAVPGAGTFKAQWCKFFNGRNVILCYDADEAGDLGMWKVGLGKYKDGRRVQPGMLATNTRSVRFVRWLSTFPPGFDVRDLTTDAQPRHAWAALKEMIASRPRTVPTGFPPERAGDRLSGDGVDPGAAGDATACVKSRVRPTTSVQAVLNTFRKHVRVDRHFEDAVRFGMSIILSVQIPGDPLWGYAVARSGGSKSLICQAFSGCESCEFRSSITPTALVSGYATTPDPSLLSVLDGRALVCKDWTEILDQPEPKRDELHAILRGAYDGTVEKSYGNGVQRKYRAHFSMLAGVTPRIHGFNKTTLGERWLKFHIPTRDIDEEQAIILAAIRNVGKEAAIAEEIALKMKGFMDNYTIDPDRDLPTVPTWFENEILALSQVIAWCRAGVDRDRFTRDLQYRPEPEVATRLAKQFTKLGMGLALVDRSNKIEREQFTVVQRTAFDTAIGFSLDVLGAIITHTAGTTTGVSRAIIQERTGLPSSNVTKKVEDLTALRAIVERIPEKRGAWDAQKLYVVNPALAKIWRAANVTNAMDHVKRAVDARYRHLNNPEDSRQVRLRVKVARMHDRANGKVDP